MRIEIGTQTVEQVKQKALEQIREEKLKARDGGVLVNGILFDSDSSARIAYNELALLLGNDPSYIVRDWKASDGVWVTMNLPLYNTLMEAGKSHISAIFSWHREREEAIEVAITSADTPIAAKAAIRELDLKFPAQG